jgi:hypothetical protein
MFRGPPLPLLPDLPLSELLAKARATEALGAWVRGSCPRQRIYRVDHGGAGHVLVSSDLGFLLTRCDRVVVREGHRPVVLEAATIIQWRALQVATATPYLPGLERLRILFPGLQSRSNGVLVPLCEHSPEEVLARCLAEGVQVIGSRVVYAGKDGKDGKDGKERTGRMGKTETTGRRREGPKD